MLKTALSQYGVKEIIGNEHNQKIIEYARACGWSWVRDDETPWCSIFMNWVALQSGYERSGRADARSWLSVGEEVAVPETGDVVIFKRGNSEWQGHVGIYVSEEDGYINVLGGNQSDSVRIAKYSKADLLGYRRTRKL
jgi:uncharacterized protein (TIGR02594 family)